MNADANASKDRILLKFQNISGQESFKTKNAIKQKHYLYIFTYELGVSAKS